MKGRILYALIGLALIASLSLGSFATPRSASAQSVPIINPCDIVGVLIYGYFEQGNYGKALYWSDVSLKLGCGFGAF